MTLRAMTLRARTFRAVKGGWWSTPAAIAVTGLVAAAVIAAGGGIRAHDAIRLVAISCLGAVLAALVAWGLLIPLRRRRVAVQAVVAVLAPVLAVAIGVAWAASDMFIMSHDLWALFVVLTAAGTVALITAVLLGRRVAAASRSVGDMARRLGEAGPGTVLREVPAAEAAPEELTVLAAELEQTSSRLAEARAQAAALEASRRELVAWVSHDLRTPLAGLRAMAEALEDGIVIDDATVARYHRTMRQEADRLAGLVNDLFELSRIEAHSLSLDFERVGLDDLVSDAIAGVSMAAAAKRIDLRGEVRQPVPVVELSTPEMARVVRNLLDNAIRHTPAGGTVVVNAGLDEEGRGAQVWVQDSCGGIPDRELARVFDMAYRGDTARTPGDGRAGLGLAVARGLVDAHHGHITVHNEGHGCRFTVTVPLFGPT
jgi:signal transduction histidine kinase